jgi:hypothetical protein
MRWLQSVGGVMLCWHRSAIVLTLFAVGCLAGCTGGHGGTSPDPAPAAVDPFGLASPNSYSRQPSFTEYRPSKTGAEVDPQMPQNRLTIVGAKARFIPAYEKHGALLTTAAYAGYRFWLDGYAGETKLYLNWSEPPAQADLWVGVGNFQQRQWDWFNPADISQVDFGALEPYFEYRGEFMFVVIVLGEEQALLDGVHLGPLPQVWKVNATAAAGGDGKTWEAAFNDLQTAMQQSQAGDEIWVAAGRYTPGTTREDTFQLKPGCQLYGGFAGTETSREERNWELNATFLSGDIGIVGDLEDNSYNVLHSANGNIIDGLTICDGNANFDGSKGSYDRGGGVYNDTSNLIIQNCIFLNNHATDSSGALYLGAYIYIEVSGCSFINNSSAGSAGAIELAGGYNNSVNQIRDCLFSNNHAGTNGGALSISGEYLVSNCTFGNNAAEESGGALISSNSSYSKISRCTFIRNNSKSGGAAGSNRLRCDQCGFYGNSAISGGAVYLDSSDSTYITSCNIVGNVAEQGSAVYAAHCSVSLSNCTAMGNKADAESGFLFYYGGSVSSFTNCLIWDNGSTAIDHCFSDGTKLKCTYSDIKGCGGSGAGWAVAPGSGGGGNRDIDPLIAHAANPGIDGAWGTLDDDYGDLQLLPGSTCIDAGKNGPTYANVGYDCAGWPRFMDDPATPDTGSGTAPIVDIGAYEFQP